MDGAKYHLRRLNPTPTTSSRVCDIYNWFILNGYPLPPSDDPNRQYPTKTTMLSAIKALNITPVFRYYEIAAKYGHIIHITPPYHCELQPIEKVWSMVKTPIAFHPDPNENLKTLKAKLEERLRAISSRQLISVWKKVIEIFKMYKEERDAENCLNSSTNINIDAIETDLTFSEDDIEVGTSGESEEF